MKQFLIENQWLILLTICWVLPWKAVALWRAAKNNHKIWFIVLFLLNTLGVLEIVYIFGFSKKSTPKLSDNLSEEKNL